MLKKSFLFIFVLIFAVWGVSTYIQPDYEILYWTYPPRILSVEGMKLHAKDTVDKLIMIDHRFQKFAFGPNSTNHLSGSYVAGYTLSITNSGRNFQHQVRVHLRVSEELNEEILFPPTFGKAGGFGGAHTPIKVYKEKLGETISYNLGELEPNERIVMQMCFNLDDENAPEWDSIFTGIDADMGECYRADSRIIRILRAISNIF